jgi:hypothetical protein
MKTLDKIERNILLRKYMKNPENPLSFDEAVKKVNKFHDYLKDMRDRLRVKMVSDQDIEIKFRKEFEQLVQSLDN